VSLEQLPPPEDIVPQRFIVEIGCGNFPFPVSGSRKLKANERYLGIDSRHDSTWGGHDPVTEAIERLTKSDPPQEGIFEVIEWDGRMIELPDDSVDEVHFQNVLGDKDLIQRRQALLAEGARILKRSGVLRVVEDDTPFVTPLSLVKEMVSPLDLIQLNEGSEQDLESLAMYSSFGNSYSSLAFVAEFGFANNVDVLPSNVLIFKPRR